MDLDASFGHWLSLRRKALRLTQAELAQHVGCAVVTLRKIEADERRPSRQIAELLARHLHVPAEERALFIKAARGELRIDRLSSPNRLASSALSWSTTDPPPLPHASRTSSLPFPPTPLVGRAQEVAAVSTYLTSAHVRLLTLTGLGGAGKTRVALEVAAKVRDQFADGVVWVALATLSEPEQVVTTIAQTLGIKEAGVQPAIERLQDFLHLKELLLVLDNFEHVVAAAPAIAHLLAAPRLKILITSRAVLRLSSEHEFPIPPLAQADAIALFGMRAQAARPDFAVTDQNATTVATICERLDGIPLAIELAAARVKLFPPQPLLARLENRLAFLTGGARDLPARQQTIRDTIDWSFSLLDETEKTLFRRLSVFVGGCTLEAAETVCSANGQKAIDVVNGMAALVNHSLVRQENGYRGEPRFIMLETIREYALERLEQSDEHEVLRDRHAVSFVALVNKAESDLGGEIAAWRGWLGVEYGNLRAALQCALQQEDINTAWRLAVALQDFWWSHGVQSETHQCYEALLRLSQGQDWVSLRAQVLDLGGAIAWVGGDFARATQYAEERLALEYQLENTIGIAYTLGHMGVLALWQGDDARATSLFTESMALTQTCERSEDRTSLQSAMLINLANVAWHAGDYAQAVELLTESLALAREIQHNTFIAWSLRHLGAVACLQGNFAQATDPLTQSLTLYRDSDDVWGITECLETFTWLVSGQAVKMPQQQAGGIAPTLARAARLLGAAAEMRTVTGHPPIVGSQAIHERNAAIIRAQLGEEGFAAAWAAGRALTLEQAIAEALNR